MYIYALVLSIAFNKLTFISFIYMNWEKISLFMRFQQKCPDFVTKKSGILDPRITPFRRSEETTQQIKSI